MKNSLVHLAFAVLVLFVGAAVEELLPKCGGVGVPVLLTAVFFNATRGRLSYVVSFALAAGALEDALGALPPAASVSFFLLAALFQRWRALSLWIVAVAYPAYHLWLWLWASGVGSVLARVATAVPFGALSAVVVGAVLEWAYGKAAVRER